MDTKGSKYYFSRLSEGEKDLYNQICAALLRFEPALSIHCGAGKPFRLDIEEILSAVLLDNPVFFYLNRERIAVKQTPMYIQLGFAYDYTRKEATLLWQQIQARADAFAAQKLRPEMSPLAKQLEIHRYVTAFCYPEPPYEKDDFSVVGPFLRGRCVCEGFAKAYKLLCDRAGIASIVVVGRAALPDAPPENHAWNITRIRGVTAHTDATWDARFGVSNYDYFNLCDADIAADHRFEAEKYPACLPNKINYFYKNGLIARDEAELLEILKAWNGKGRYSVKLMFELDAKRLPTLPFGGGTFCFNPTQNIISYFEA